MATFWCLCWKGRVRFGHEVLQNPSHLIQFLSKYLLALLASSTCVVVCSAGLQQALVGCAGGTIPRPESMKNRWYYGWNTSLTCGTFGSSPGVAPVCPLYKKAERGEQASSLLSLVLAQGAECPGDEPPGKGGGGEERSDLMLLEVALVSHATLQLSSPSSDVTLPTLAADFPAVLDSDLCSELGCISRNKVCQIWERTHPRLSISCTIALSFVSCLAYNSRSFQVWKHLPSS